MLIASALEIARLRSESCLMAIMLGMARNAMIPMIPTAARTSTREKARLAGVGEFIGWEWLLLEFDFGVGTGDPGIESEILPGLFQGSAFYFAITDRVADKVGDAGVVEVQLN